MKSSKDLFLYFQSPLKSIRLVRIVCSFLTEPEEKELFSKKSTSTDLVVDLSSDLADFEAHPDCWFVQTLAWQKSWNCLDYIFER